MEEDFYKKLEKVKEGQIGPPKREEKKASSPKRRLGKILIKLAVIGFILSLLMAAMIPAGDGHIILWGYSRWIGLPLLTIGIILTLRRNNILAFVLIILFILPPICDILYRYILGGYYFLEKKAEKIIEGITQVEKVEQCNKIRVISFLPQSISNYFFGLSASDSHNLQDHCKVRTVASTREPSLCVILDNKSAKRDRCYIAIAQLEKDPSICYLIGERSIHRKMCIEDVESGAEIIW